DPRRFALSAADGLGEPEIELPREAPDVRQILRLLPIDQGTDLVGEDVFRAVQTPEDRVLLDGAHVRGHVVDHLDLERDVARHEGETYEAFFSQVDSRFPLR